MNTEKKILLVGGSGFIGKALQKSFISNQVDMIKGREIDGMDDLDLSSRLENVNVVINLAGYPIIGRWNKEKKRKILESRIFTTRKIVQNITKLENKPHLINASAIGIYKNELYSDESSEYFSDNFLSEVVQNWEGEVKKLENTKSKYTIIRIGIVLGKEGGAYKKLRKLTGLNMGAVFSGGKQSLSFIYIDDLVRAIHFIIENEICGIINLTAPESTDYLHLMKKLKRKRKAIFLWNAPGFLIRLIFGEASLMFLQGHKVYPAILLKNSFNFIAPNIESCIEKIESN